LDRRLSQLSQVWNGIPTDLHTRPARFGAIGPHGEAAASAAMVAESEGVQFPQQRIAERIRRIPGYDPEERLGGAPSVSEHPQTRGRDPATFLRDYERLLHERGITGLTPDQLAARAERTLARYQLRYDLQGVDPQTFLLELMDRFTPKSEANLLPRVDHVAMQVIYRLQSSVTDAHATRELELALREAGVDARHIGPEVPDPTRPRGAPGTLPSGPTSPGTDDAISRLARGETVDLYDFRRGPTSGR